MDVKAVSWVGDMYQKFEAMCVEVEETVYQDTVKYVESQVTTVGACVKRFYSDVMQDLLPLSSDDPVKPESPYIVNYDGDVIHDISKVNIIIKKEPMKASTEKLRKDSYPACRLGEKADDRLSAKSYNAANLCELPVEESSGVKCRDLHVEQSDPDDLNIGNNESEEKLLPSEILAQTSLEDGACEANEGKICEVSDGANICAASTSIISSSSHLTALDELGNGQDMLKELDGTLSETFHEIESDYADKQAVQISEHGKMKLEESCVLVDGYEPVSPSHLECKQRSYKKKLKDVFYPRSWSRSKNQGHVQLTFQLKDMDSNSNHGARTSKVPAASPGTGNDSFESGWEIL